MHATDLPSTGRRAPAASERAAEADIALYYAYVEALVQRGAPGLADRFLADDFVAHDGATVHGRAHFVADLVARHARHPNAVWTIELLTSVAGLVICHVTMTEPTAPSSPAHPPAAWETVVARVAAGRIVECWCVCDDRLRASSAAAS